MKTIYKLFFLLSALLSFSCYASTPPVTGSLAPMLQKVLPAVVNIRAQIKITDFATYSRLQRENKDGNTLTPDNAPDKFLSIASGVIVDADNGYVLTNAHVVTDAEAVTVTLGDGRHYNAKVIGMDKPSDVA